MTAPISDRLRAAILSLCVGLELDQHEFALPRADLAAAAILRIVRGGQDLEVFVSHELRELAAAQDSDTAKDIATQLAALIPASAARWSARIDTQLCEALEVWTGAYEEPADAV